MQWWWSFGSVIAALSLVSCRPFYSTWRITVNDDLLLLLGAISVILPWYLFFFSDLAFLPFYTETMANSFTSLKITVSNYSLGWSKREPRVRQSFLPKKLDLARNANSQSYGLLPTTLARRSWPSWRSCFNSVTNACTHTHTHKRETWTLFILDSCCLFRFISPSQKKETASSSSADGGASVDCSRLQTIRPATPTARPRLVGMPAQMLMGPRGFVPSVRSWTSGESDVSTNALLHLHFSWLRLLKFGRDHQHYHTRWPTTYKCNNELIWWTIFLGDCECVCVPAVWGIWCVDVLTCFESIGYI